MLRKGSIVDDTIISARDSEIHEVKNAAFSTLA